MNTTIVTFLSALLYDFKNDSGKEISGVSLRFLTSTVTERDNSFVGVRVEKVSLPVELWNQVATLNAFDKAELTFSGFGKNTRISDVRKVSENEE